MISGIIPVIYERDLEIQGLNFNPLLGEGKVNLQESSKRLKSLLLRRYVRECVPYCPDIRLDYRYNRVHDQFQLFLCQHALPDAVQNGEMLLPLITHTKMYRSKHSYKFSSGFRAEVKVNGQRVESGRSLVDSLNLEIHYVDLVLKN